MDFEFDPRKNNLNLEKHGISLEEVQELWDGVILDVPVASKGEARFLAIGRLQGEYWSAIYTMRGEVVRIISARRSNQKERSDYDRYINE